MDGSRELLEAANVAIRRQFDDRQSRHAWMANIEALYVGAPFIQRLAGAVALALCQDETELVHRGFTTQVVQRLLLAPAVMTSTVAFVNEILAGKESDATIAGLLRQASHLVLNDLAKALSKAATKCLDEAKTGEHPVDTVFRRIPQCARVIADQMETMPVTSLASIVTSFGRSFVGVRDFDRTTGAVVAFFGRRPAELVVVELAGNGSGTQLNALIKVIESAAANVPKGQFGGVAAWVALLWPGASAELISSSSTAASTHSAAASSASSSAGGTAGSGHESTSLGDHHRTAKAHARTHPDTLATWGKDHGVFPLSPYAQPLPPLIFLVAALCCLGNDKAGWKALTSRLPDTRPLMHPVGAWLVRSKIRRFVGFACSAKSHPTLAQFVAMTLPATLLDSGMIVRTSDVHGKLHEAPVALTPESLPESTDSLVQEATASGGLEWLNVESAAADARGKDCFCLPSEVRVALVATAAAARAAATIIGQSAIVGLDCEWGQTPLPLKPAMLDAVLEHTENEARGRLAARKSSLPAPRKQIRCIEVCRALGRADPTDYPISTAQISTTSATFVVDPASVAMDGADGQEALGTLMQAVGVLSGGRSDDKEAEAQATAGGEVGTLLSDAEFTVATQAELKRVLATMGRGAASAAAGSTDDKEVTLPAWMERSRGVLVGFGIDQDYKLLVTTLMQLGVPQAIPGWGALPAQTSLGSKDWMRSRASQHEVAHAREMGVAGLQTPSAPQSSDVPATRTNSDDQVATTIDVSRSMETAASDAATAGSSHSEAHRMDAAAAAAVTVAATSSPAIGGTIPRTVVDLAWPGWARALNQGEAHRGSSLSKVAKAVTGQGLDKACRISDWDKRPLSCQQLHYGACDAFIPVLALASVVAGVLPLETGKTE